MHKRHCRDGKLFCPLCTKTNFNKPANGKLIKLVTDHYNKCLERHPYRECRRCDTKLPSFEALAEHCKLMHPDESCEMCGAFFETPQLREQHQRDDHNV